MKNFLKGFAFGFIILIWIWSIMILNNQEEIKSELNQIRTTQDSLHTYYKFNHLHHYSKHCDWDGADLEGDN